MTDPLDIAERRLGRLEAAWLITMSLGTLLALEFGIVIEGAGHISASSGLRILLFLALGILATPLTILFLLPCWNVISPIQDRITIWETEMVVFVVTCVGLTISSVYFFDISIGAAIKTQILLVASCFPILWITAQYRWYAETERTRRQLRKPVTAIERTFEETS